MELVGSWVVCVCVCVCVCVQVCRGVEIWGGANLGEVEGCDDPPESVAKSL